MIPSVRAMTTTGGGTTQNVPHGSMHEDACITANAELRSVRQPKMEHIALSFNHEFFPFGSVLVFLLTYS